MAKVLRDLVSLRTIGTPSTPPPANEALLYVKSDGRVYTRDSAGVEREFVDTSALKSPSLTSLSLVSTEHPFQLGPTDSYNLAADPNKLQARNNGAASTLGLNLMGGLVWAGGPVLASSGITSTGDIIADARVIADGGSIEGSSLVAYDGITAAMGIQAGGDITAGGNLWSQGVTVGDPTGTRTVLNLNQLAAYTTGAASSTLYLNYAGGIVSLAQLGGTVYIGTGAAVPELQFGANARIESSSGYLHMNWHNNLPVALGSGSTTNRLGGTAWQCDGYMTINGSNDALRVPNMNTSSTSTIGITSAGYIRRHSSSIRYKENLVPLAERLDADVLIQLEPKLYQRNDFNLTVDEETGEQVPGPITEDTPWNAGFIAEEARDLGLKPWLQYWGDQIDGFDYSGWTAAQQVILRQHHQRIADLEARNAALEERLAALEARL